MLYLLTMNVEGNLHYSAYLSNRSNFPCQTPATGTRLSQTLAECKESHAFTQKKMLVLRRSITSVDAYKP